MSDKEKSDASVTVDQHTHKVTLQSADKAAALVAGFHAEITEEEKNRVKRKIDWHLMPILCVRSAD